jgi:hypothetical protein
LSSIIEVGAGLGRIAAGDEEKVSVTAGSATARSEANRLRKSPAINGRSPATTASRSTIDASVIVFRMIPLTKRFAAQRRAALMRTAVSPEQI